LSHFYPLNYTKSPLKDNGYIDENGKIQKEKFENDKKTLSLPGVKQQDQKNAFKYLVQVYTLCERFIREINATRKTNHPNIMRILDAQLIKDPAFYVAEYISGRTLDEFIRQQGPIPLKQALAVLNLSINGLQAVQANGVIHRDLKPANIMLTPGSSLVKIIDFGIARNLDMPQGELTQGAIIGTLSYLPPEIHNAGEAQGLDHKGDIFMLAITLYEMLTGGKLPHDIQDIRQHFAWSQSTLPTFPDMSNIPSEAQGLLKRMGEKNPHIRINYPEIQQEILRILRTR